jgi:acyl transferase domain-containing protein
MTTAPDAPAAGDFAIALIGMAGRFPGAGSIEAFWENLRGGVESIRDLTDDELEASGVDAPTRSDPTYVRRGAVVDGEDLFDAAFFEYSPRDAALLDPQQRLLLECSAQALQVAGYDGAQFDGPIGIFASEGMAQYGISRLYPTLTRRDSMHAFAVTLANEKDYLATRLAYKLDLRGPAFTVQTACSSSLVAVHLAAQSLLAGECDIALVGGVSVRVPQRVGYYPGEGIASPDGRCRAFDADAGGTVVGNGVCAVILRRLEDALADGDTIRAVVRGTAVNNDGADKIGYTAPSVRGQARVIRAAHAVAGVTPETVGYVEAHGTATPLGDPIEVAALSEAFGRRAGGGQWCAIGSVKTNIGHLDAAAGLAGFIKAALVVEKGLVPPSLHFRSATPNIDFESTPFFVNTELREWPLSGVPRRAGVSSFGIGGTNAHAVLEQPPPASSAEEADDSGHPHVIALSARSRAALDRAEAELAARLQDDRGLALADVAWTLQAGRPALQHRRAVVANDRGSAARALLSGDDAIRGTVGSRGDVVFLFPGQGSQCPGMGGALYRDEPAFREEIDRCAELLRGHIGDDIRTLVGIVPGDAVPTDEGLANTALAQPALFGVEYALARLFESWGIAPAAMLGHSVGEYVAACLAGVFDLEDALAVVAARGRLIGSLPAGAMTAVALAPEELQQRLPDGVEIAAVNAPRVCVASGPDAKIGLLEQALVAERVDVRRLRTSHAFHSAAVDPALDAFRGVLSTVVRRPPRRPYLSNVTGGWASYAAVEDAEYWVRHLRSPVRFADAARLAARAGGVFLELGPRRALSSLVRLQSPETTTIPVLHGGATETEATRRALARLWCNGVGVDWRAVNAGNRRRRVSLPTYPFERHRYWVDGVSEQTGVALDAPLVPTWARRDLAGVTRDEPALVLVGGFTGAALAAHLAAAGRRVRTCCEVGRAREVDADSIAVRGPDPASWLTALDAAADGSDSLTVVDARSLDAAHAAADDFETVAALLRAASDCPRAIRFVVVTRNAVAVESADYASPADARVRAACALATDMVDVSCVNVDVGELVGDDVIRRVADECCVESPSVDVAFRGLLRWERAHEPHSGVEGAARWLPRDSTCLVVGNGVVKDAVTRALRERLGVSVRELVETDGSDSGAEWVDAALWFHSPGIDGSVAATLEEADRLAASVRELCASTRRPCIVHIGADRAAAPAAAMTASYLAGLLADQEHCAVVHVVPDAATAERLVGNFALLLGGARPAEVELDATGEDLNLAVVEEAAESDTVSGGREPRSEVERGLAEIWRSVLGVRRVGLDDDFFDLGGHSLVAGRVSSRLRDRFGVDVTVRMLLEHPTLAQLAVVVEDLTTRETVPADAAETAPNSATTAPLSFAQERVWFLDRLQPASPMSMMVNACRMRGPLDVGALKDALSEIVRRQWSLRTAFRLTGARPEQVVLAPRRQRMPLADLTGLEPSRRAAEVSRVAAELAATPLDLERGEPLKTALLMLHPEDNVLVFGFHHIVSDHWSTGIFMTELLTLYEAFSEQRPSPLPELALQYVEYSLRQRKDGASLSGSREFWREQLAGAPSFELRGAKPRPDVATFRGEAVPFEWSGELTGRLEQLATAHRATPFMVLLTALQVLLARESGVDDVCVGTLAANRDTPEVEEVIGLFVNPLVLRTRVRWDITFSELLRQVRATCLDAYSHARVPFEQVIKDLSLGRDLGRNPLYQIALIVENAPGVDLSVPGLRVEVSGINNDTSKLDLTLVVYRDGGGPFYGFVEFSTDCFDRPTLDRLFGDYEQLLEAGIDDPDRPLRLLVPAR